MATSLLVSGCEVNAATSQPGLSFPLLCQFRAWLCEKMIPYIIISFPFVLFALLSIFVRQRKLRVVGLVVAAIIFTIFIGFRYDSVDYYSYVSIYYSHSFHYFSFPFFNTAPGTTGNEIVFATVAAALNLLNFDVVVFFVIIATASTCIKFLIFYKYSPYFFLSVVVYLAFIFVKDLGQIRNALAASLFLLALHYASIKNLKLYLMVLFVAFGIQAYALIALPIYWIVNMRSNRLVILALLLTAYPAAIASPFIITLLLDILPSFPYGDIFASRIRGYYLGEREAGNFFSPLVFLNICFGFLSASLFYRRLSEQEPFYVACLTSYVVGLFLYLAFHAVPEMSDRSLELLSWLPLAILLPAVMSFLRFSMRAVLWAPVHIFLVGFILIRINTAGEYQNVLMDILF